MKKNTINTFQIIEGIKKVNSSQLEIVSINPLTCDLNSDGIIFFKPEVCNLPLEKLVLILNYFKFMTISHSINIQSAYVIRGDFLIEKKIIKRNYEHSFSYSIISSVENKKTRLHNLIQKKIGRDISFFGGFFLISQGYSPSFIMELWLNSGPIIKFGEDCYGVKCFLDKKPIFLINGFLPYQFEQYKELGSKIIFFSFQTMQPFEKLKMFFQGSAEKTDRPKSSMRQFLADFMEKQLLEKLTTSRNGIHLSSNKREGLREFNVFKDFLMQNSSIQRGL